LDLYPARYSNSLEKLIQAYPDGAPIKAIAEALGIDREEVNELLQQILIKMRSQMS
jgi:transposase-like protein